MASAPDTQIKRHGKVITLTLEKVASRDRLFITSVLGGLCVWSLFLLLEAVINALRGEPQSVPSGLVICAGFYTYGVITTAIYRGSYRQGWRYGRLARVLCAGLMTAASLSILWTDGLSPARSFLIRAVAAAIIALSAVRVVREFTSETMSEGECLSAGLLPSILLIVEAALRPGSLELTELRSSLAAQDADPILSSLILPLALASPAYVLVGAAAWALFTVKSGLFVSRRVRGYTAFAVILVGAKLVWLLMSVAGKSPFVLGGRSPEWEAVRGDGIWSYLLASAYAVVLLAYIVVLDRSRNTLHVGSEMLDGGGSSPAGSAEDRPDLLASASQRLSRWLHQLNRPRGHAATGMGQAEPTVARIIWALAIPGLAISALGLLNGVSFGVLRYPGVLPGGAIIGGLYLIAKARLDNSLKWLLLVTLGPLAILLILWPSELPNRWEPSLLWAAVSVQLNYAFVPGLLGLVALTVTIVQTLRIRALRRSSRFATRSDPKPVLAAAILWTATLLPVSFFFTIPLLEFLPFERTPSASFHIVNLLRADPQAIPQENQPGWEGPGGTFEWSTFDAILTIGMAAYLLLTWKGKVIRREHGHQMIVMLCLVSTLAAHSGTLSPVTWGTGSWLYCAIVFPAFYELLFNSKEASREPGKLFFLVTLSAVAVVSLGVMTLNPHSYIDNSISLDSNVFAYAREFGPSFFVYPMAMTYLLFALTSWRKRASG